MSERVTSAESFLLQGQISVKDFVRAVPESETYRKKFFEWKVRWLSFHPKCGAGLPNISRYYDRISTRLQQINKRGGKVVSITIA